MNIDDIRKIGRRLKEEIPPLVWEFFRSEPLGKGAGGDKTYLIDKKAEDIVFEEVEKLGKPVTIISEEYGTKEIKGGGRRLLVDPVDGSRNAVSGIPLFSTSIALIEGDTVGDVSTGYVINLISGDEFWAIKGEGSIFNGKPVRTQQDDSFSVIAYETQTPRVNIPTILPLLSLFNRVRCFGSTALDMAFLAQGALSMFVTPAPSRSFDFAAGYLLIKEAGGIITDINGKDIDHIPADVKRSTTLLASGNEVLHTKALEMLKG
jgi:myo-inositol-1(or 4)-monophosphatase